jgi:predicted outer membrane repeat protein
MPSRTVPNRVAGLLLLVLGWPASADTFFVPQDFPTIQAAINAAVDGDSVIIQSGTYTERLDTLGKRIMINGVAVNPPTILGTPGGPVIRVRPTPGQVGVVQLMNLTVRDGDAALGGAIQVDAGARLHLFNSRLWQNEAAAGGAIVLGINSFAFIRDCDFWQNSSDSDGGAIYALSGADVRIEDTLFEANTAVGSGGALRMSPGAVELGPGVRFLRNTAAEGGAVSVFPGAELTASQVIFDRNVASGSDGGGAIFAEGAVVSTSGCSFLSNSASGPGGGMRLVDSANADSFADLFQSNTANSGGGIQAAGASFVSNIAQFIGNQAVQNGGAISSTSGSGTSSVLRLYNARLRANSAGLEGGAINMSYTSVGSPVNAEFLLANSVVHGNNAGGGTGGIVMATLLLGGGMVTPTVVNSVIASNTGTNATNGLRIGVVPAQVHNSILWDNQGAELGVPSGSSVSHSIFDSAGAWPGAGNIAANPLFRNPGAGDFSLRSGSPAIDAGNNARVPADLIDDDADGNTTEPLPLDFPGRARFHDDPATANTGVGGPGGRPVVDIGAYEFPRSCLADFAEPLGAVDFFDLSAFLAAFNAGSPSADIAAPFGVWNFFDVSAFLAAFNAGCP